MSYLFFTTKLHFRTLFSGLIGGWLLWGILIAGVILFQVRDCRPTLKRLVLPLCAVLWLVCEAICDLMSAERIAYHANLQTVALDVGGFCLMLGLGLLLGMLLFVLRSQKRT